MLIIPIILTDKEIQNDIRYYNIKSAEVNQASREVTAIGFPEIPPRCAERRLNHTIVHYLVPVFACNNSEEHSNASDGASEVCASSNLFSVLHSSKKYCSRKRVEKYQEKHSEDNEERLAD